MLLVLTRIHPVRLCLQRLVVHMPSCLSVRWSQGLRDSGGASLEINRIYTHFQKVFMKTPPFLGALSPKTVGMGPRGHMAGVISNQSCMQVVTATSDGIW